MGFQLKRYLSHETKKCLRLCILQAGIYAAFAGDNPELKTIIRVSKLTEGIMTNIQHTPQTAAAVGTYVNAARWYFCALHKKTHFLDWVAEIMIIKM